MAHAPTPADPQPRGAEPMPAAPPGAESMPPASRQAEPMPPAPRGTPAYEPPIPDTLSDAGYLFASWLAHVQAGRIGHRLPVSPEIVANRDRWTALARSMRR